MSKPAILAMILCTGLAPPAAAQSPDETEPGKKPADSLDLVPLVDMEAPLVAIWYVAAPRISLDDASAIESQVYEEFFKRMDIRVLSREKILERLAEASRPKLLDCAGADECLVDMGQAVKADRIVGVLLRGAPQQYRLILKSIVLDPDKPAQLTSIVEGGIDDLLIGGIVGAVKSLFEADARYAPLDLDALKRRAAARQPPPVEPPPPPREPVRRPEVVAVEIEAPATAPGTDAPGTVQTTESAPDVETGAPERPGFFRRHLGSALLLGTGVATAAAGITFGSLSRGIEEDMEVQYDPDQDQKGKDYALAANILFGVAGAAAITSILLFFFVEDDDGSSPSITVAPAGAGVQALFRF